MSNYNSSQKIAEYLHIGAGTVSAIRNGQYDYLLEEPKPEAVLQVQDGVHDQLEEILDVLNVIEERLGVLITNA